MRSRFVGTPWTRAPHTGALESTIRMLLPLLTVAACGGVVSRPQSALEKAATDYATAECEKEAVCADGGATRDSATIETCVKFFTKHQLRRSALGGLNEGVEQLTARARSISNQTCGDFLTEQSPGCMGPGTKNNGDQCIWDEQCQTGFCGEPDLGIGERCKTCHPRPTQAAPCVSDCGLLFDRPHGLVCVGDAKRPRQCVPLGSEGASCKSVECETNLICTPPGDSAPTCSIPSATLGDPCDAQFGPFCDTRRGIYCNANTHLCDLPRTVGEGETCGPSGDGSAVACDARTFCRRAVASDPRGTCVARFLPDGAACNSSASPRCEFPAICEHAPGTSVGTCRVFGTDHSSSR